jgi:hypothetical protein
VNAIVTGAIATYPVGGVAWDYGHYALGLERLGFEVYYLEDNGMWSYDPSLETFTADAKYGVEFLRGSLATISPSLGARWHYRAADGRTYGIEAERMEALVAEADVFINVSGLCLLRDEYMRCGRKVLIDTDPGWNHFFEYPAADRARRPPGIHGYREHDVFFTYAESLGTNGCRLPALGLEWQPTRPPVVLDAWEPGTTDGPWTTVMNWNSYDENVAHDGVVYGAKDVQFQAVAELPLHTSARLELAVADLRNGRADVLRKRGWSVVDAIPISRTADSYREYVRSSRGEFSVAKNVYVATRSGWFSCRSVCYLACSRPVVLEDTGFSAHIATGDGLFAYSALDGAADAIARAEAAYDHHAAAARDVAQAFFASDLVLADLLERAGIGGL